MIEGYFRTWQIDSHGNIREIPFPESEPLKEEGRDNIYSLNPHYAGFMTKRIKHFEVTIFNWKPRNAEAEKQLALIIRASILMDFDPGLIERSGGIDSLVARLDWFEWW